MALPTTLARTLGTWCATGCDGDKGDVLSVLLDVEFLGEGVLRLRRCVGTLLHLSCSRDAVTWGDLLRGTEGLLRIPCWS